jgi:hypothetical protein
MTWLEVVRVALDEAASPRPFFFRDDDAGWRDDRLRDVLDCFQARGLPIDMRRCSASSEATWAW